MTASSYLKTYRWSSAIALIWAVVTLWVAFAPGDLILDPLNVGPGRSLSEIFLRQLGELRILGTILMGLLTLRLLLDYRAGTDKTWRLLNHICSSRAWLLTLLVLATCFFVWVKWNQHFAFETSAYDLSMYHYAIANTADGNFMYTQMLERSFFSEHVAPVLLLLVPVYWVVDHPAVLVVVQALATVAAAIPLYLLSRDVLKNSVMAVGLSIVLLNYAPFIDALMFDFHMEIFEPAFILAAFLFLQRRQFRWYLLFAVLAMSCKEDVPVYFLAVGAYIWVVLRNWRYGLATLLLGLAWVGIALEVVIPLSYPGEPQQSRFLEERWGQFGSTAPEIIRTMIANPLRLLGGQFLENIGKFFGPLGLVGLVSPVIALLSMPILLLNSTVQFPIQAGMFDHYALPMIPFAFVATVYGLRNVQQWLSARAWFIFAYLFLVCTLGFNLSYVPVSAVSEADAEGRALIATIPPDRAVAAQTSLVPHLGEHDLICVLPLGRTTAEYVMFDVERYQWPIEDRYEEVLDWYLNSAEFERINQGDRFYLFRRIPISERGYDQTIYLPSVIDRLDETDQFIWPCEE